MTLEELQALVRRSHDQHFSRTELRERLRDLANQVSELTHHRDAAQLAREAGDAGWSLLQLCNELQLDFADVVQKTVARLDVESKGKSVALIGTSANPITNAHLTMALEILALTDVHEVWFYLVGEHPWAKKLMPAEHRLEMVRLAIARYPKLRACDFEMVHGPRIYEKTRETAEVLRDFFTPAYPGYEFSWVMGSDVAQTFEQWKGADWMAANLRTWVIHRLGYDWDQSKSLLTGPRHVYLRENVVTSNISSSLVRERGRGYEHEKLIALVPDVVWDYLVKHRLLDPDVLR